MGKGERWAKQQHPKIHTGNGKHPWVVLIKALASTFSTFPCPLPINNSSLPPLLSPPVSPRNSSPLLGLASNLCPEVFLLPKFQHPQSLNLISCFTLWVLLTGGPGGPGSPDSPFGPVGPWVEKQRKIRIHSGEFTWYFLSHPKHFFNCA